MISALYASPAAAVSYADRVRERVLPNGLKILLLEDHKAPVAVFQIWYRVGSRDESLGHTGLSHLLEHMMFKGTDKVGPEDYSKIIQRNGGNTNAFTSQDSTTYFATMASDRIAVVNELEADRMAHLKLRKEDYIPEQRVVMEERRLRTEDSPVAALFELIDATAYTAHPYGWPVIGWMDDIRQATLEDLGRHYRAYYEPNNAVIVAVGDFKTDQLLTAITKEFGGIPSASPSPAVRAIEPPQQGERRVVLRREARLPYVGIVYHVPNLRSADAPALEVLAGVLSGGKSARLYREIVYRQRLARETGADYDYISHDPGLFTLFAQPLPGKKATDVGRSLLAQIKKVQNKDPSAHEIAKAKNRIEARFIFGQDSVFYQGMLLGRYEMVGDWRMIDEYLPKIRAVTRDDVRRVAASYLVSDNRTVGILEPLPATQGQRARPVPPAPPGVVK
jgi:zinc protease